MRFDLERWKTGWPGGLRAVNIFSIEAHHADLGGKDDMQVLFEVSARVLASS
jgi:hypothetical protein